MTAAVGMLTSKSYGYHATEVDPAFYLSRIDNLTTILSANSDLLIVGANRMNLDLLLQIVSVKSVLRFIEMSEDFFY